MKIKFLFIALVAIISFHGCGSVNSILTNNSNDISISENENKNSYSLTCKFSKNYSEQIRAIILKEYPEFDFKTNQVKNNLDINLKLKNKRLEIGMNQEKAVNLRT